MFGRREKGDPNPPVVGVWNSNEDTIEMLRVRLESAGYVTVAAHVPDIKRGKTDLADYMAQHKPQAVVYDIAPPYEENWAFYKLVSSSAITDGVKFVLTSTNKQLVEKICGGCDIHEIIGKPYDIDQVAEAVKKTLGR
jgi:CheY-like chemotaxis protein